MTYLAKFRAQIFTNFALSKIRKQQNCFINRYISAYINHGYNHRSLFTWPQSITNRKTAPEMISADQALKGRSGATFTVNGKHTVLKSTTKPPFPESTESLVFGMGCFWGVERLFWKLNGVHSTQVGYAGGFTPHPTYKEVCSGNTGHTEVVRVIYDPKDITSETLLRKFWEEHDPCQGNKQGADVGSQYRSAIYYSDEQQAAVAQSTKKLFEKQLPSSMKVTTEIKEMDIFYYAEDYHQQYLDKNPNGYCGMHGTGYKLPDITKDDSNTNCVDDNNNQKL